MDAANQVSLLARRRQVPALEKRLERGYREPIDLAFDIALLSYGDSSRHTDIQTEKTRRKAGRQAIVRSVGFVEYKKRRAVGPHKNKGEHANIIHIYTSYTSSFFFDHITRIYSVS